MTRRRDIASIDRTPTRSRRRDMTKYLVAHDGKATNDEFDLALGFGFKLRPRHIEKFRSQGRTRLWKYDLLTMRWCQRRGLDRGEQHYKGPRHQLLPFNFRYEGRTMGPRGRMASYDDHHRIPSKLL
jgi:hypothetical protein